MYENDENYIISYLCWTGNEERIETQHQKIIQKEEIETRYIKNIFKGVEGNDEENSEWKISERIREDKMIETLVGAIIGAILGGLMTYLVEERKRKKEYKKLEKYAASVLYYDLKSIEQYMLQEEEKINLRYSNKWQDMVAKCVFLNNEDVMYLYKIYDEVYNYNEAFNYKITHKKIFKKEKINSYKKLQALLFASNEKQIGTYAVKYEKILKNLENTMNK